MPGSLKGAAIVAAMLALGTPALADCKPLTLITSVDLVLNDNKTAAMVPVTLQGSNKLLLLDTGGAMTEITPQAADELGLTRIKGNFQLFNVSGEMSDRFVHTSLQIGRLKADDMVFAVSPGQEPLGENTVLAGILAPDILRHYDVDIDYGAGKLNLLSQDHCDGKVIYWPAEAVAVVPIRVMDSGHIQVPVMLDGHQVLALLDTGAYNTTLTQPTAVSTYGLTLGSADTPKYGDLPDRDGAFTYRHVFKSLGFEGIAVSNVQVDIIPDLMHTVVMQSTTPELGTHMVSPKVNESEQPMLIGMNILKHFHIYIAYKESKLYITPAVAPQAVAAH